MESLGVLLLHPMNAYLEKELDRRCRLIRLWDSPPERRDDFLRAVVGNANYGADAALPALEIVASFSVGIDRVDLAKCRERGIRVTNTPDVLTDDVADLAVGLAIAVMRRIPQADRYVRAGQWKAKGDYTLTTRFSGKRVAILGLGRIRDATHHGRASMTTMACYLLCRSRWHVTYELKTEGKRTNRGTWHSCTTPWRAWSDVLLPSVPPLTRKLALNSPSHCQAIS